MIELFNECKKAGISLEDAFGIEEKQIFGSLKSLLTFASNKRKIWE